MTGIESVKQKLQPHLDNGLDLWLEGEALRFKAPKEMMTPDLIAILKANKPDIIDWLNHEAASSDEGASDNASREAHIVAEYPLAYTQGAIWMLYQFAPNSPAYNTAFVCTLKEAIDETAVRQAFHTLLVKHPVLRSTFLDTDQGPRQRVWSHLPTPLNIVDGSQWNEEQLQQELDKEADAPFDLYKEPCLRVTIIKNSVKGDVLVATIQHVGADLWALLIVAEDIKNFYQTAAKGEPLSVTPSNITYEQHVAQQEDFINSPAGEKQRFYWQQQLNGAPLTTSLPTDKSRPPLMQLQAATFQTHVATDIYGNIKDFCKQNSVTPFVFVQSAFQLMVHQYTQAQDFLIGTPTMGRSAKGMDQVVGDFANPVVLRADITPDLPLQHLFKHVQKTLLAAMEYQEYPFPLVVQDCAPPRDSSRTPLFQLMFVWHQGNMDALPQDGFIDTVLPMSGPRGAPYDVMLAISDLGDRFELNWSYQTSLYSPERAQQFAERLSLIIEQLLKPGVIDTPLGQWLDNTDVALPSAQRQYALPNINAQQAAITSALENASTQTPLLGAYLEQHQAACVADTLSDRAKTNILRLFIEDSFPSANDATLFEHFHDVVRLKRLPLTPKGNVDSWALRQLATVNRQALHTSLEEYGLSPKDVVVHREQRYLPTYCPADLRVGNANTKTSSAASPQTLIANRPDAWMRGEPLETAADYPSHLCDALLATAQQFPTRGITFITPYAPGETIQQRTYPYTQLVIDAEKAAAGLKDHGLKEGHVLLLQMVFDERFFALWWGAVLMGVRPLVVSLPDHYHERNGVAQKLYNVSHNFDDILIAADPDRVDATTDWLKTKTVINAETLLNSEQRIPMAEHSQETVAFLQLSAGSTGTPKSIQINHTGILHQIAAAKQLCDYTSDDTHLNWLPFDHVVPILTTHLKDVTLGIQQYQLPTPAVLNDPLLWMRALSDLRITHSWAPNFAYQLIVDALKANPEPVLDSLDLSCVKFLMNAGEQVLAPVVQNFTAALQPFGLPANAVQPSFGMAEACTCMTYNNVSDRQLSVHFRPTSDAHIVDVVPQHDATHGFVDLGAVSPGIEVRITNSDNQLVKEGVIGRMQIRGPVITPGYFNNPEANAESFVGDNWFNSGDLGFIWNNRLILTGREKETIIVNGANFYCFDVEQAVANVEGVLPTFVAATGVALESGANSDALVIFYVVDTDQDLSPRALERKITASVTESHGITPHYLIAVEQDNFYKTTSGKIQRSQFKKRFEAGEYQSQRDDYDLHHNNKLPPVDTVFGIRERQITPTPLEQLTPTLISLHDDTQNKGDLEHHRAVLNEHFNSAQQAPAKGQDKNAITLLNYGVLSQDQGSALPLSTAGLLSLSQQLGVLSQHIASYPEQSFCLWFQAEQPAQVATVVRPLLATLQQETGHAQISAVITVPNSDSPDLPPLGTLMWQNLSPPLAGQWIPTYSTAELINLPKPATAQSVIARKGCYLITGGLGGLAEPLCDYLIKQCKAKIIVSSRSELQASPQKQARFDQLQKHFGQDNLTYVRLADLDQPTLNNTLTQQIPNALETLGCKRLDGVFHLAGHLEMMPLDALDSAHWNASLQVKADAGNHFIRYLEQHYPDSIFVQYGSLNGYFGGQAAAAYSVASATQSALTRTTNRHSTVRSWCWNWSVWQGAGMAEQFTQAELQMARNKGFLPLDTKRDSNLIGKLLQLPPDNYLIGLDAQNSALQYELAPCYRQREQVTLFADASTQTDAIDAIQNALKDAIMPLHLIANRPAINAYASEHAFERNTAGDVSIESLQQHINPDDDVGEPPANCTESDIAEVWSHVLGRSIPDVTRSFFEYGGHSINATQVIAAINQKLDTELTVTHLFQHATVRELAHVLSGEDTAAGAGLSLTLADCLQRAQEYRIDAINPEQTSTTKLVFLPNAMAIAAAFAQMSSQFNEYESYIASSPLSISHHSIQDQQSEDCLAIKEDARQLANVLLEQSLANVNTVLIGWSYGGVLGYEINALLAETQPNNLPKVIMLDSGIGEGLLPITFEEDFEHLMFASELGMPPDKLGELNAQPNSAHKLALLLTHLHTMNIDVEEQELLHWWRSYDKRLKSLLPYKPRDSFTEGVVYQIEAAQQPHGRSDMGWTNNTNITWSSVQTDHQGIVKSSSAFDAIRKRLT